MSTNNNRLEKEVRPDWKDEEAQACQIKKFSADKLQRLLAPTCSADTITALSLSERGVTTIENTMGLSSLRRLDLSKNKLKRLSQLENLSTLGMLNVSGNELAGADSIEDLRYLTELRTLNIGENPGIRSIHKHTIRSLPHLQALVAHQCGLSSIDFLNKVSSLTTLILSKNLLETFPSLPPPSSFDKLLKLSIGHNRFTSFPDLSFCRNMEELRINNNAIGTIPRLILNNDKLKTLDISSNQISSWASIELLTGLPNLTNLSAKGNPLPEPPPEDSNFVLREDFSAEKVAFDETQLRYRRHLLGLFQIVVGKEQKLKVRLIVLDMKRVKAKWSHRNDAPSNVNEDMIKPILTERSIPKALLKTDYIQDNDGIKSAKKKSKKRNRDSCEVAELPQARVVEIQAGELLGTKQVNISKTSDNNIFVSGGCDESVATAIDIDALPLPSRGSESGVVALKVVQKMKKPKTGSDSNNTQKSRASELLSVDAVLFGKSSAVLESLGAWE